MWLVSGIWCSVGELHVVVVSVFIIMFVKNLTISVVTSSPITSSSSIMVMIRPSALSSPNSSSLISYNSSKSMYVVFDLAARTL